MKQSSGNRRQYPLVPRRKSFKRLVLPGRQPQRTVPWLWFSAGGVIVLVVMVLLLWHPWQGRGIKETPVPRATATLEMYASPTGTTTGTKTSTSAESPTPQLPLPTVAELPLAFDAPKLARLMLGLINRDRAANGLGAVVWDDLAAKAGTAHAEDMATLGYMSHWNLDGHGPDFRYTNIGGQDVVMENIYRLQMEKVDSQGPGLPDWSKIVENAQLALMQNTMHRVNILSPKHTHVGIGIAYNANSGDISIVQEFVNRYVQLQPLPRRARPGERVFLRGQLISGSQHPLVNVAYEPIPSELTLSQLEATKTYSSSAQTVMVVPVAVTSTGEFIAEFRLDTPGQAGWYHVRLWVEYGANEQVPAADVIIEVR